MNTKQNLELAHWTVKQARQAGADDAAVNIGFSRDIDVEVREQKLDRLQESTQNSLSLTIYAGGKYSSHSTNDLRKETLSRFVSEAVGMTRYLSVDKFRTLPDPKYYTGRKKIDLKTFDDSYEGLSTDERVAFAMALDQAARSRSDKVLVSNSGVGDSYYESVKVHSNGFEGTARGTSFYASTEATVGDNGEGRPSDYDYAVTRFRKKLPAPETIAHSAVDRALTKIGQSKMKSGIYDLVIENRAASRMLSSLMGPMSGSSLQQKQSYLDGKLGEKIASEKFTMVDDPFIVSGFGSCLFDGEGMTVKPRVMIDKGVLKSYYISYYYGLKLGMEPTLGSSTNLVFEYGDKSLDEIVAGVKKGILVNSFIGGNSNSLTGDFSVGVIGTYIENGKLIQPVNEMNISGNLADVMMQLVEVGNDPYTNSSWRRPSLHFENVNFSGI